MPTEYILLRQRPDEPTVFDLMDVTEADQAAQAVRRLPVTSRPDDGLEATFIAVPVRNWSVVNREVERPPPRVRVADVPTDSFLEPLRRSAVVIQAAIAANEEDLDRQLIVTNVDDGPESVPVHVMTAAEEEAEDEAMFHMPPDDEEDPDGT